MICTAARHSIVPGNRP